MPVTLTTFPPGSVIDATALRARLQEVQTYINEGVETTDRADGWMRANHVYRPDFYGSPNHHTTFVTGESYTRSRPVAEEDRQFFSYFLGSGPYPVPGLNATIQIPESLTVSGSDKYRLVVCASFYVYEFGGADAWCDEESYRAANIDLLINGEPARSNCMVRYLYKGSITSAEQAVPFYPRKQVSLVWGDTSTPAPVVGCNNIGIAVSPRDPGSTEYWKHLIFANGNLTARYFLR